MADTSAVGKMSRHRVWPAIALPIAATATKMLTSQCGYCRVGSCVISISGAPNMARTTMPTTMPATRPTYVSTEDTILPAEVMGKPLIPSCTADTIRRLGTRRINDAAIISAGSRKISSQYSPNARAVAMLPPAIVANTSGARQRVITNTVAILKVEAPRLSRAENQDPPINNTKAEAQTPLATNDTQCGKV